MAIEVLAWEDPMSDLQQALQADAATMMVDSYKLQAGKFRTWENEL